MNSLELQQTSWDTTCDILQRSVVYKPVYVTTDKIMPGFEEAASNNQLCNDDNYVSIPHQWTAYGGLKWRFTPPDIMSETDCLEVTAAVGLGSGVYYDSEGGIWDFNSYDRERSPETWQLEELRLAVAFFGKNNQHRTLWGRPTRQAFLCEIALHTKEALLSRPDVTIGVKPLGKNMSEKVLSASAANLTTAQLQMLNGWLDRRTTLS